MIHLRLTTDERASAPAPIPFPGRRESLVASPGRSAARREESRGLGRMRDFRPGEWSVEQLEAEIDRAFDSVQDSLDELNELAEVENPLPMRQWRWDGPDDGPRAA